MTIGEEVRKAIRNLIEQYLVTSKLREPKVCKVLTVNAGANSAIQVCDCKPLDGSAIVRDVTLITSYQNNQAGFMLVPKVNSLVQVSFNDDCDAFVSMVSAVDFIYLNGNDYGGLVNAKELKTQLDKNNQLLTHILSVIKGAPIDEPGNGAPSALQTALQLAITTDNIADLSNIENTTVLHGTGNLN